MTADNIDFDAARLRESLDNDEELLRELLTAYIEDAPVRLAALERGVAEDDPTAVTTAAHSIKGMSGVIRIPGLEQAALELEMAGRDGKMDRIRDLFPRFRENLRRVLAQAGAYLA